MKSLVLLFIAFLLAAPLLWAQESYGTIRETTKIGPDGSKITTILDPEKHTSEETVRDAHDKVLKKTTYLLGDRDVANGAIFYDAKGKVSYQAAYRRDDAGRIAEASFTAPDGRYLGKRVFVYGAGNAATQVIDYDANGQAIAPAQPVAPTTKKRH